MNVDITHDNYNIKTVDKGTDLVVRFFFLHSTGSGKILILSKMWKVKYVYINS